MLTVLQSKKFVTAELLADKFEISIRTVYRDIKALGEIGIPLSFQPHKGYFIVQGYFLPPVLFTSEEANALALMESLAHKFGDKSITKHYAKAMDKIKAVLRSSQKEKLEYLHSQIKIHKPSGEENERTYLSVIQSAITEKNVLKIDYQNSLGQKSTREIEPIGMTFYGLDWHLIAWCWKTNEYRDFKASRILSLINTFMPFRKSKHFDITEYIKSLH